MKRFLNTNSARQGRARATLGWWLIVFVTLAATKPAAAQPTAQQVASKLDAIFEWTSSDAPGCAVSVSHRGQRIVDRAYGSADLERKVPLSPDSVFDVGSLTKQFVAAAVLLLVEDGEVSLSGDIRKYISELPDPGHVVTVDHLLTHTSGMRDWTGIAMLATKEADALTLVLRQHGLNFPPGEEWSYSNSGYVLLKELVARKSGMAFAEFVQGRLFTPLGMTSTRYVDDLRAIVDKRALAYENERGKWRLDVLLDSDRGGGGALFSTAGDLTVWNEAVRTGKLTDFVTAKLQEPAKLNNGRTLDYARGLFLDSGRVGQVIWHTGSAAGYKALLSRYPEHALSIAIVCNSGDGTDRSAFARGIVDLVVPGQDTVDEKTVVAKAGYTAPASFDVSSRAGLFFSLEAGKPLLLVARDGELQVAGGPALMPLAENHFRNPSGALTFVSQDEFELRFLSPDEIEFTSMEGQVTRYRRARPFAPTPEDLRAFTGSYQSNEIGAVFRVGPAASGSGVRLELDAQRSLEFRPVDRDTFQRGRMTVRFRRNVEGGAVALELSNPMLRDVEFVRVGDERNP